MTSLNAANYRSAMFAHPSGLCNSTPSFPISSSLVNRIKTVGIFSFKVCSSFFLFSYGMAEIGQSLWRGRAIKPCSENESSTVTSQKVLSSSRRYLLLHGGLLAASGGSSIVDILSHLDSVSVTSSMQSLVLAGNLFFLCSHILALKENLRLYEIVYSPHIHTIMSADEIVLVKRSLCSGIISSLGYIVTLTALLFSGLTAIVVVMAIFSCFAGGIKILYDLYLFAKHT